jgi:chemotaxis protein MotA
MDIASIIGLIGAVGMILGAMISGGGIGPFIDVPSILIVFGGTFFAVMYTAPLPTFLGSFAVMAKAFLPPIKKMDQLVERMSELAAIARKDGMIALEGQDISNPFMAKAVSMLVDGSDEDMIKKTLGRDIEIMKLRHKMGASFFAAWGEIAPAMGMIGTLVGLVLMLGNMSDPKSIGPAMAVALLTTMYGAILANVVCLPISMKLTNQSDIEAANCELIIEGTLFIQSGGNPRVLSDLLSSFVAPKARAKLAEANA